MVAVYPLLVIPHPFYITFPAGVVPPGYFYAPRYVILMIVSLVALIVLLKDRTPVNQPAFIPLFFFMVFLMISSFLAPVPMTAWIGSPFRFTGATTWYACIVLFILASSCRKAEKLLGYLCATAAVVSSLAVLQYFGINLVPHEPAREGLIAYGTLPHPNFLGTYTVFILPAAAIFYLRTQKWPWLLCSALIYAGLLVSLCRGSWMAGAIGIALVIFFALKDREKRKPLLLLGLAFLIVTLALLPARDGLLLARMLSVPVEAGRALQFEDAAGSHRLFIWKKLLRLIPHFWAFGVGPDHLIYGRLALPDGSIVDKAHNIFLEIAVTMGLFALASYSAFLCFILRPPGSEAGFAPFVMVLVYLLQGLFNIDVVVNMPLFWIVMGVAVKECQ
jgi:O-antigen ligase